MRRELPRSLKKARNLPPQPVFENFLESLSPIEADDPVAAAHPGGASSSQIRQSLSDPQSPSSSGQHILFFNMSSQEKISKQQQTATASKDEVGRARIHLEVRVRFEFASFLFYYYYFISIIFAMKIIQSNPIQSNPTQPNPTQPNPTQHYPRTFVDFDILCA